MLVSRAQYQIGGSFKEKQYEIAKMYILKRTIGYIH